MQTHRWLVGLKDGCEMWVIADEARVDAGHLVLSRRTTLGWEIVLALAPGEWTKLTPQRVPAHPDLSPALDRLDEGIDASEPPASLTLVRGGPDRRQVADRRRAQLAPQPGLWDGINRRSGSARRAS